TKELIYGVFNSLIQNQFLLLCTDHILKPLSGSISRNKNRIQTCGQDNPICPSVASSLISSCGHSYLI
ncbi:hypothetical protein STEG23_036831, partial [Scotinomys teguina]